LAGTGSGHGGNEETVSQTVSEKIFFDSVPIVSTLVGFVVPEIELEKTFGSG
jgi:hypothetical protein